MRAWQDNDVARAESLLGDVLPRFQQAWETRSVRAAFQRKAMPLLGHTGQVSSVAFSPDGGRVLSGSEDKTLKVWDAATGQEKLTLRGHTGRVWSVAFSPDGGRVLSGSADGTAKVWDAATGQEKLTLRGHTGLVSSVAFSPDGGRIASEDVVGNRLDFDAATGQRLPPDRTLLPASITRAEQPGGKLVAIASSASIIVYGPITDATEAKRFLHRQATRRWHTGQAEQWEEAKGWPAAAFHLERLHRTGPGVRPRLLAALRKAEEASAARPLPRRLEFAIVPVDAVGGGNPMTGAIRRNLAITDAARAASALGLLAGNPLACPLRLLPATR